MGGIANPDLDVDGIDWLEGELLRFNKVIGVLWLALWYPLARMQAHRGASHWFAIGTLTRMLYLLLILSLLLFPFGKMPALWEWLGRHWQHSLIFLGAQELAVVLSHLLVDSVSSWLRKVLW